MEVAAISFEVRFVTRVLGDIVGAVSRELWVLNSVVLVKVEVTELLL